jgi:hypothetical protein
VIPSTKLQDLAFEKVNILRTWISNSDASFPVLGTSRKGYLAEKTVTLDYAALFFKPSQIRVSSLHVTDFLQFKFFYRRKQPTIHHLRPEVFSSYRMSRVNNFVAKACGVGLDEISKAS